MLSKAKHPPVCLQCVIITSLLESEHVYRPAIGRRRRRRRDWGEGGSCPTFCASFGPRRRVSFPEILRECFSHPARGCHHPATGNGSSSQCNASRMLTRWQFGSFRITFNLSYSMITVYIAERILSFDRLTIWKKWRGRKICEFISHDVSLFAPSKQSGRLHLRRDPPGGRLWRNFLCNRVVTCGSLEILPTHDRAKKKKKVRNTWEKSAPPRDSLAATPSPPLIFWSLLCNRVPEWVLFFLTFQRLKAGTVWLPNKTLDSMKEAALAIAPTAYVRLRTSRRLSTYFLSWYLRRHRSHLTGFLLYLTHSILTAK